MNDLEQRLRAAAEETRQLARTLRPQGFVEREKPSRSRGWLVFSTAFAAVALTFGLIPWLASNTPSTTVPDGTPSQTAQTTPTTVATTMGTAPEPPCSSDDVPPPSDAEDLPAAVAATRNAIADAAADCDFGSLETLAADTFTTSFGGGGVENLRSWEDDGQGPMGTLLHLLDMTYGTIPLEGGGEIYVWPAAATYESWEAISEKELDELSAIYSEGELDQLASAESYLGWRTGIDQNGNWLYFIAGD